MKKTIIDYDLKNKKVLIRCDFNVPIKNGKIVDDNRIVESLETINYAIKNEAKVILLSHLGKVKSEEDKKTKSLQVVSERLSILLSKKVMFIKETRGVILEQAIANMHNGDVILIENVRFEDFPGKLESSNNKSLAQYWANLVDIYINDAFGTAHRTHASNVGVAQFVNSGIGFLVEKEINKLSILNNPEVPYVVILGGAKISDKIEIVSHLVNKADKILIGGGMAYTFLKAKGYNIGKSICDNENIEFANTMLKQYKDKIILPIDSKVSFEFEDTSQYKIFDIGNMPSDGIGLDIGPKTIKMFKSHLEKAKTIFWNGTLGYSEFENFSEGTRKILDYITSIDCKTILGGGDTVAASKVMGYKDKVTYASTGGGATLEYICGKELPGLSAITDKV